MLGTIVNSIAVIIGCLVGLIVKGRLISEEELNSVLDVTLKGKLNTTKSSFKRRRYFNNDYINSYRGFNWRSYRY